MIHVSSDFKAQMEVRTDFKEQAEVTFADGTKLSLTENDFTVSNNSLTDGAGSSGLPLGAAIQRQVQIELMNDDDHLESYDFVGAQIRLYMTFRLPKTKDKKERIEKIEYGYFTVTKPETYGQTVIVTAADDMYRADKKFYSDLSFPTSAQSLFVEMCEHCGIQPGNTAFPNCSMLIQEKPGGNDLTFRNVFGYLAMLASGNARISRSGTLEILSYDFSVFDQEDTQIQTLRNFESLKFGTEDVIITGIRMKTKGKSEEEDQTFLCGQEGYLLEVENPLAAGWEQQLVDSIGKTLVGVHLRDFSGDHVAYPLAEFMDPVYIEDRKGRTYPSVLTDIDFSFCGMTTFKNSAVSAIRNSSKFSSSVAKTYEEIRKITAEERSARETAIENLARRLETSSGLYCTKDEQPDGSIIYYMHDKAELEDSMIIWKLTAEAIGISTDGGKTYPTGIDATGTAILDKIYAVGLDATYITSGTLIAKDAEGKVVFSVNVDTGEVQIDASSITMHSESLEEHLDGLQTAIDKSYTDATQTATALITEAVKEYVKTSDLETLREEIRTQFIQSSDSFEMTFNKLVERITELQDDTSSELSEIKKYIRFKDGNIILGQEENPLILTLQNNRISFSSGGQEVAYFSDDRLYVDNVTVKKSAEIVGLKIKQESGHIYIDW